MGRITTTNSRRFSIPAQRVEVNGRARREVYCEAIALSTGTQGGRALFSVPAAMAGDSLSWIKDAEVVVWSYPEDGRRASAPLFRGFVAPRLDTSNATTERVTFEARSPLAYLSKTYAGQAGLFRQLIYSKRDALTRGRGFRTLSQLMQSIFSSEYYPSAWRGKVALGSLDGIQRAQGDVEVPDITFNATPLSQAMARLLQLVPSVSVRERFTASKTYLDFYLVGERATRGRVFSFATNSTGPEQGALGKAFVSRSDNDEVYSRAIGFGRPYETMVTFESNVANGLQAYWPTGEEETDEEAAILANPLRATPGHPLYAPQALIDDGLDNELGYCFRRYRLPAWVRDYDILRENLVADSEGNRIPAQCFLKIKKLTTSGVAGDVLADTASVETWTYEQIEGFRITPDGVLELPRPAVYASKREVDADGLEKTTYLEANVLLTVTLSERVGRALYYDTGVRGDIDYPGISSEGLVYPFVNNTVGYRSVSTPTNTWQTRTGEYINLGAFYEVDGTQTTVAAGSPVVIEDDSPYLAALCEAVLAERQRRRTTANCTLFHVAHGLKIGDTVRVLNRGIDDKRLQVVSIAHTLRTGETKFQASDQVPAVIDAENKNIDGPPLQQQQQQRPQMQAPAMTPAEQQAAAIPPGAYGPPGNLRDPFNDPGWNYDRGTATGHPGDTGDTFGYARPNQRDRPHQQPAYIDDRRGAGSDPMGSDNILFNSQSGRDDFAALYNEFRRRNRI